MYGFQKKLFYLNFNIHSYQFFQCSCNIPIMHWETTKLKPFFFFKQYHFLPHVYAFFLLLNNDFFFIYTNKTYIKIYSPAEMIILITGTSRHSNKVWLLVPQCEIHTEGSSRHRTKFDYWYLNVKHTLKDPVDIATKFDYWYICT